MKRVCLLLLITLLAGIALVRADEPIYARLVVPLFFESEIPADIDRVAAEVNRISREKIGASVELVPLLYLYGGNDPLRVAELEMLTKQGVSMDIYPSVLQELQPAPLDDLLARYGQGILTSLEAFRWSFVPRQSPIYRLDSINDHVTSSGLAMRRDIVEKHGIDLPSIQSLEDVDALFETLSVLEPDLTMVSPYHTRYSLLGRLRPEPVAGSTLLEVSAGRTTLASYYATETYREQLMLVRRWHQAGYLPENLVLRNLRASQLVQAGELFSYFCAYKPGIEFEESQCSGVPMVVVPLRAPMITGRSLDTTQWSVSADCVNPGKAVQFLNLLYTDAELVNLLMYGIEGEHYRILRDSSIDYPEGVDAETVGYRNTLTWLLPHQGVARRWRGVEANLWEELLNYNLSTPVSVALGFAFDAGGMAPEAERVAAAIDKYAYGLETGQLDPDTYLPALLGELQAAGAAELLAEAQRQYAEFLAEGRDTR